MLTNYLSESSSSSSTHIGHHASGDTEIPRFYEAHSDAEPPHLDAKSVGERFATVLSDHVRRTVVVGDQPLDTRDVHEPTYRHIDSQSGSQSVR